MLGLPGPVAAPLASLPQLSQGLSPCLSRVFCFMSFHLSPLPSSKDTSHWI